MRKTADTHKQEKFKASRAMNEQTKAMQIKKKLLLEKIKENRLKRGLPNYKTAAKDIQEPDA